MTTVTNYIVSGLSSYVEQNRDLIIGSFGLANRDTRSRVGIQTGVKSSAALHYLAVEPVIQDGSSCGFNPFDTITLSQRLISVAVMKVDGQICPETLLGKYAEYLVRVNARDNELPFEQYVIDTLIEQVNKKIETVIWQGKTAVASIALVAKKPEQFGKAMLLPAMVETFALFAFLISFLAVANVGGAL